jgi:hypothetical protein
VSLLKEGAVMDDIKPKSPLVALHEFASKLTTKVRELEQMERAYLISPGQSTEILSSMIESHLYATFKTMIANERVRPEDREAAAQAAMKLLELTKHTDLGLEDLEAKLRQD